MARLLYSALYTLLLPLFVVRLLVRSLKASAYRQRLIERFGIQKKTPGKPIWIHAVSVGETIAISPLVERLLDQGESVLFTTTTPTGAAQVKQRFGGRVEHRYLPWDLPIFFTLFFGAHSPKLLLIVETEIWPNLLSATSSRKIPIVLANARLSEKSFQGYSRFSGLTKDALNSISLLLAQHESDAERFKSLGMPEDRLLVSGSIKFDIDLPEDQVQIGKAWNTAFTRKVLVAASTHQGEDKILLDAWRVIPQDQRPVLILVPRHPERFDSVYQLAKGYSDKVSKRSLSTADCNIDIWIGDSLGEMFAYYAAADLAFVGGSFSGTGGHNPLEPAALGLPIVTGPSDYNFRSIISTLKSEGALVQVQGEQELAEQIRVLLGYDNHAMSQAGIRVVEKNRGAMERLYEQVKKLI
ncbi:MULTISPECIES: lipid IV(A) 3-deoxy-D-manno-octulosonic acid transferase [unclassified Marinobacterium]|uniref:lipid IV(A) 3-deoxy-D-manno-octulosonic acid transferase n=1 Tax=unclassified Marinobacterium TaxID=2644139 RepID=UPI00156A47F7|nr:MULTISPECIES: lipid IV(A) 3-deoxy-D-manno-octulosonic acid transferase [unclassified Marinobacterium]NRP47691.1 3-deoxy-D-manno-octulosonic acid transferase [Marinobacterium sp. xm-d-543]NRQ23737.1 3-deoxy-D-manno-octulosonic acid transferase [Marinobacterium sp. xm-m-312]